ncbi:hypothetical protein [Pseudomonas sp. NPDC087639]|uniref:hypothetical protein n=1 Tax=Pseudomonas sp. NPDC087639 TaxID=3364445 RepID=UPI003807982E
MRTFLIWHGGLSEWVICLQPSVLMQLAEQVNTAPVVDEQTRELLFNQDANTVR